MISAGVYSITNTKTGGVYVGSSVDVRDRLAHHRDALDRGKHCNSHLQRSWNKHGGDTFVSRVLLWCDSSRSVWFEQRAMDAYRARGVRLYNINPTAYSCLGVKRSPETRAKVAAINVGRKHTPESRANMSAAGVGRPKSAEWVEKVAAAHRGRTRPAAARENMARAQRARRAREQLMKLNQQGL